jgi:hypothetical protein
MSKTKNKVKIRIPISKKLLEQEYGYQCPDYEKDCVVCQAWVTYKEGKYVVVEVNREALFKFIWSDDNELEL